MSLQQTPSNYGYSLRGHPQLWEQPLSRIDDLLIICLFIASSFLLSVTVSYCWNNNAPSIAVLEKSLNSELYLGQWKSRIL